MSEIDAFFSENPVPASTEKLQSQVVSTLKSWLSEANPIKVALVTSGGTIAPLEKRTVRYIDNFSTGNRGARAAEEFLKAGWKVIFLHRQNSKTPFSSFLPSSVDKLFNLTGTIGGGPGSSSETTRESLKQIIADLQKLDQEVDADSTHILHKKKNLCSVQFASVATYLSLLRSTVEAVASSTTQSAEKLQCCLVFLAAAVSDFHMPFSTMAEHKIQSSGGLTIELQQVPKMLGKLREWYREKGSVANANRLCVCSFKLETNPNILDAKAAGALKKYGLDFVIANTLETYKKQCWIIHSKDPKNPDQIAIGNGISTGDIQGDDADPIEVKGITKDHVQCASTKVGEDIEVPMVKALLEKVDKQLNIGTADLRFIKK